MFDSLHMCVSHTYTFKLYIQEKRLSFLKKEN